MGVLVIDTCGAAGYVATLNAESAQPAALSERRLGVRATQEELLPAVEAVLRDAELTLAELCAVAVTEGPGSFTGVRIGLATAKGLCEAMGLPLVTLSRLAVLSGAGSAPTWAWLQAGRAEVYAGFFGRHNVAEREGVYPLTAAIAAAAGRRVAVCEEALREATECVDFVDPSAFEQTLLVAAADAVREGTWKETALADARYVRVPDAELALRARQG